MVKAQLIRVLNVGGEEKREGDKRSRQAISEMRARWKLELISKVLLWM